MIKNPEPLLVTAGGKIICRRCKAQSSRTKLQCAKPALNGKAVCSSHGGRSTGPKTKEGKAKIRAAHYKHGEETLEAKAERSEKSTMFYYLELIGNHVGLFDGTNTRGRKPKGVLAKLDLNDPEQLVQALSKTLPKEKPP
jgi:hypothetical protein